MTMMTDLPQDLVEEILSRVPLTSLSRVRSTCKKWNTLSKDGTFSKKQLAQAATESKGEILTILLINYKLYLMSVNFHNRSITHRGNLISLNVSDELEITRVCQCDGLFLCVTKYCSRVMVWNPYSGQTWWISDKSLPYNHKELFWYCLTLGYDRTTHKVLRIAQLSSEKPVHEIYYVNSNSWRVLDVTPDWYIMASVYWMSVSVKGNAYWYARDKETGVPGFLLCFDYTTESFAPRLPLPFESHWNDDVSLSKVREEQLAVLFHHGGTSAMEIWITTKIEPKAVSWTKVLAVDMKPWIRALCCSLESFIVDQEKKVVVLFIRENGECSISRNAAYFLGENSCFKKVDLGKIGKITTSVTPQAFSYVPSSVHISSERS